MSCSYWFWFFFTFLFQLTLSPSCSKTSSRVCLILTYMFCHFLAVLTPLPSPIQPKTCIIYFRILSKAESLVQYSFSFWLLQRAFSAFNLHFMFISEPNVISSGLVFSTLGRHSSEPRQAPSLPISSYSSHDPVPPELYLRLLQTVIWKLFFQTFILFSTLPLCISCAVHFCQPWVTGLCPLSPQSWFSPFTTSYPQTQLIAYHHINYWDPF